jgi:GNAT superfamily N-acetyltransferase
MTVVDVVDPRDEASFDAWFAVLHVTDLERYPDKPGWQRAERLAQALDEDGPEEHRCLMARDGHGTVTGIADVEMFRRENRHVARVDLRVLPEYRRRGVGSALLDAATALTTAMGRTELGGMDESPTRTGYVDAAGPFAVHHGFAKSLILVRRQLWLPMGDAVLSSLLERTAQVSQGYDFLTFGNRWPDEYLDDRCLLGQRMSTDIPIGDQELDEEVWDATRVRQLEQTLAAQNRGKVSIAARHRDSGHLVGFTEVAIPLGAPEYSWQHDTLVIREHRGHGLGLAMKVRNVVAVLDAHPEVQCISTWNAQDNKPMIAVNEEMGFVVQSMSVYWLKTMGPIT